MASQDPCPSLLLASSETHRKATSKKKHIEPLSDGSPQGRDDAFLGNWGLSNFLLQQYNFGHQGSQFCNSDDSDQDDSFFRRTLKALKQHKSDCKQNGIFSLFTFGQYLNKKKSPKREREPYVDYGLSDPQTSKQSRKALKYWKENYVSEASREKSRGNLMAHIKRSDLDDIPEYFTKWQCRDESDEERYWQCDDLSGYDYDNEEEY